MRFRNLVKVSLAILACAVVPLNARASTLTNIQSGDAVARISRLIGVKTNVGAPNCMGATLYAAGVTGGALYAGEEFSQFIKLAACKTVPAPAQFGDIGVVETDMFQQHSVFFTSAGQFFEKAGTDTDTPYRLSKSKSLCANYPVFGLCSKAPANSFEHLNIYRCNLETFRRNVLTDPVLLELDRNMRIVERVLSSWAIAPKGSALSNYEFKTFENSMAWIAKNSNRVHSLVHSKNAYIFFQQRLSDYQDVLRLAISNQRESVLWQLLERALIQLPPVK